MDFEEIAFTFECRGDPLVGIVARPEKPSPRGVLIAVGGPQYRVGSHRQFTLLARALAASGIPSMRFDYRGMGDSDGDPRSFEDVGEDLGAATDAFVARAPGLREVVLWGLCDAASAAIFRAPRDARIAGMVLLNPWVRTDEGISRARLKHYYLQRLADPDFWRKLGRGGLDLKASAGSLLASVSRVLRPGRRAEASAPGRPDAPGPLPDRMARGFAAFGGPVLLVLSGDDLTAQEFRDTAARLPSWRGLLETPRVTRLDLPEANHTFSRREWRDEVARATAQWVRSW